MTQRRRLPATIATALFMLLYCINGVAMLSTRQPSAIQSTVSWLCGGMMLYLLYHAVRCVYGSDPAASLSPAADLWIGGSPLSCRQRLILLNSDACFASAMKASLLMVALWVDAASPALMFVGLVTALWMVDVVRDILLAVLTTMRGRAGWLAKFAVTSLSLGIASRMIVAFLQIEGATASPLAALMAAFLAIGSVAASDPVVAAGVWLQPAAMLATSTFDWTKLAIWIPLSIVVAGTVFAIRVQTEVWRTRRGSQWTGESKSQRHRRRLFASGVDCWLPASDILVHRSIATAMRYRGTIAVSFILPTILCLSPIFAGTMPDRWIFVVGGVAFCTAILAPSALKIDFRSDLRRMSLLRALPVTATEMAWGQIAVPIGITWIFQAVVLSIATYCLSPGVGPTLMWLGLLMALAVVTFATENTLFLAFPYHAHDNGLTMVVRAKLTFLAKATVLVIALLLLAGTAFLLRRWLGPYAAIAIVILPVSAASLVAAATFGLLVRSWRRFDLANDLPLG